MNTLGPFAPLLARILIGGMFVYAGLNKVMGFAGTVAFAQSVGLPSPELAIALTIVIEIVAGLSILLGYQLRWGALVLIIFVLAVNVLFHADFSDPMQQTIFIKNLGIMAALLYMLRYGTGKLAVDKN